MTSWAGRSLSYAQGVVSVPIANVPPGTRTSVVGGMLAGADAGPVRVGVREVLHELDGGEQGLVVLVLVLHDHPVDEPVGEERIPGVEHGRVEDGECPGAHVARRTPRAPAGSRIGSDGRSRRGCLNASYTSS